MVSGRGMGVAMLLGGARRPVDGQGLEAKLATIQAFISAVVLGEAVD